MPSEQRPFYKMTIPQTLSFFKEETYIRILNIPGHKPSVERLVDLIVCPEVLDYKLYHTKEGRSYEGVYISGTTLLVVVNLRIKITYIDASKNQSLHVCDFESIKVIDVILPNNMEFDKLSQLVESKSIHVVPYIEFSEVVRSGSKQLRQCGLLLVEVNLNEHNERLCK